MVGYTKKVWLTHNIYVRDNHSVYLTYYYITYTTIYYYTIVYQNILIFTYTNILFNIHTLCKYATQYIKEQYNNNVFNAIKRIPNHRICYTVLTLILHYFANKAIT